MVKKIVLAVMFFGVSLAVVGAILFITNEAPAVASISSADAANPDKPYVVKLHAQWCPVCMVTKAVWSQIEERYATRVKLLVLDFTTDADVDVSRREAARLGLEEFFDEFSGATGIVVVLDGRTKEAVAEIGGSRDFDVYRAAIDAALGRAGSAERLDVR
jgi:thiol-disulfide isomerase/thioredoxin